MMAIRGWGAYLRDVLKVLAIHGNFPTRFDRHSITALSAGSPQNWGHKPAMRRTDGLGNPNPGRIPSVPIKVYAPGGNRPRSAILLANATTTML